MKFECELESITNTGGPAQMLKLSSVTDGTGVAHNKIVLTIEGRCVVVSPQKLIDATRRVVGLEGSK
jgi:hypothetical protein